MFGVAWQVVLPVQPRSSVTTVPCGFGQLTRSEYWKRPVWPLQSPDCNGVCIMPI
jgi:hypothetical protein